MIPCGIERKLSKRSGGNPLYPGPDTTWRLDKP